MPCDIFPKPSPGKYLDLFPHHLYSRDARVEILTPNQNSIWFYCALRIRRPTYIYRRLPSSYFARVSDLLNSVGTSKDIQKSDWLYPFSDLGLIYRVLVYLKSPKVLTTIDLNFLSGICRQLPGETITIVLISQAEYVGNLFRREHSKTFLKTLQIVVLPNLSFLRL